MFEDIADFLGLADTNKAQLLDACLNFMTNTKKELEEKEKELAEARSKLEDMEEELKYARKETQDLHGDFVAQWMAGAD